MTITADDKPCWVLRVEAINLGNFIYDTDDLSTIRGGGLLILNTHRRLVTRTQPLLVRHSDEATDVELYQMAELPEVELELISAGASASIFLVRATASKMQQVQAEFDRWLREDEELRFATFAIQYAQIARDEPAPMVTGFQLAESQCLTAIRRAQMREPTLTPGFMARSKSAPDRFCDIDGVRPAVVDISRAGEAYARAADKNWVSRATEVRRRYGRELKIRLYGMFAADQAAADTAMAQHFYPTWSFEELTARGVSRCDNLLTDDDPLAALAGKMAVLYIDGNKFGRLVRGCRDATELNAKDGQLRSLRATLMRQLMQHIQSDPKWRVKANRVAIEYYRRHFPDAPPLTEQARIETLLWGGDELIWVVPAWCAVEIVEKFFEWTSSWNVDGQQLTHALGLVICSHKAPIRSIVTLAKELAESIKSNWPALSKRALSVGGDSANVLPLEHSPAGNMVAYEILESFDVLGRDFSHARAQRRFPAMPALEAILSGEQWSWFRREVLAWKASPNSREATTEPLTVASPRRLPTSRLHQIVNMLHLDPEAIAWNGPDVDSASPYGALTERTAHVLTSVEAEREQLVTRLHATPTGLSLPAKWHHLMEFWDYVRDGA